jgi:hypothetical protein
MEPVQYLMFLVVPLFIGGYYFFYFRKVKNAGGYAAMFARANQMKFGLGPTEVVDPTKIFRGQFYIGPLTGTGRSGWQQLGDALTNTTYRGRGVELAITSGNRLVVAGEPLPDSDLKYDASMGDTGYRPIESFDAAHRPALVLAEQAFGADPNLEKARKDAQTSYNAQGQTVKWDLAVLKLTSGESMVLWLDPAGILRLQQWCATGT